MDFIVAEAEQENGEMEKTITRIRVQDSWRIAAA